MENKLNTYLKPDLNESYYYLTIFSVKKILIFLLLLPLFIYSCKDDIVGPSTTLTFDSARFDWDVDTIWYNFITTAWSCDTSNLYCVDALKREMVHLNSGFITNYQFVDFYPWFICGTSNYNIYIGGAKYDNSGSFIAHLKKWDGAGFTDYPINIPGVLGYIKNGYAKSSNEIWLGTRYYILKFDGQNFLPYPSPDTNAAIIEMFEDASGYPTVFYYQSDFPDTTKPTHEYIYQIRNNQLVRIFDNSAYGSSFILIQSFKNGTLFGRNQTAIYNFSGSTFTKYLDIPISTAWYDFVYGNSYNNFLAEIGPDNTGFYYVINWNEHKWSKEFIAPSAGLPQPFPIVVTVNERVYYVVWGIDGTLLSYIYRGIKK